MSLCWRAAAGGASLWFCVCALAQAAESNAPESSAADQTLDSWRSYIGLEAWVYSTARVVRTDSVLNPDNQIVAVPSRESQFDTRLTLRADSNAWQILVNSRGTARESRATGISGRADSLVTIDQGLVRFKSETGALTIGREVLTWGPSQFRSPSNPFYFDSDRTNPLAAPLGIDLLRGTQSLGRWRITAGYVVNTDRVLSAASRGKTALLKVDGQGDHAIAGTIFAHTPGLGSFIGGFAQMTISEAWLAYVEFDSGRRPWLLQPDGRDGMPPFTVRRPAPRSRDALAGLSYTLTNGQVVQAEYLRSTGGFTRADESNYFQQAASTPDQAIGLAPRLLGRNYVWLQYGSNPQNPRWRWFTNWSQNLNDGSGQAVFFAERRFASSFAGLVMLVANTGSLQSEFSSLSRGSVTIGLKWFLL